MGKSCRLCKSIWRHFLCLVFLCIQYTSTSAYKGNQLLEASLRLGAGTSQRHGHVEIMHNGTWASICRDDFGLLEAECVCRHLGFTDGMTVASEPHYMQSGSFRLRCRRDEPGTVRCNTTWLPEGCASKTVARVQCTGPAAAQQQRYPTKLGGSHKLRGLSSQASSPVPLTRPSFPPPLNLKRASSPPRQRIDPPHPTLGPKASINATVLPQPVLPKLGPSTHKPPQARPKEAAPPPIRSTTCEITITGSSGPNMPVLAANVSCVSGGMAKGFLVNVTVGSQLLHFAASWTGVAVSQRRGDDGWGITFNDVPYIQLRNSVVRNLTLNSGPLVHFANCSQVVLSNVSVLDILPGAVSQSKPSSANGSTVRIPHGPLLAVNVTTVSLEGFNCSGIRGSFGWACIMLLYSPDTSLVTPRLEMVNCSFADNRVARDGLYGTAGVNRCIRSDGPTPAECIGGHGAVVVAPAATWASGAQQRLEAHPRALEVTLERVTARFNRGGVGAFFSSLGLDVISFTISRSNFSNNEAVGDGGVFNVMGPVRNFLIGDATQVMSNKAGSNGGALSFAGGVSLLRVSGGSSLLVNEAGDGYGGAIWSGGPVDSIQVTEGSLMNGNYAAYGGGAAVGELGELVVAERSAVVVNAALCNGGALWVHPDAQKAASITIDGKSNITYNEAGSQGGALWAGGGLEQLSCLRNSSVAGNIAAGSGGAVAVPSGMIRSVLLADGSAMAGNIAGAQHPTWPDMGTLQSLCGTSNPLHNALAPRACGGALAVNGSIGSIELRNNSLMYGNTATHDGGAVWVSGKIESFILHTGSSALLNRANGSGGLLWAAQFVAQPSPSVVFTSIGVSSGSRLVGNSAGLHGGALMMRRPPYELRVEGDSEVANNTAADGNGGAFCFWANSENEEPSIILLGSRVSYNTAGQSGGALYLGPGDLDKAAVNSGPPRVGPRVADTRLWWVLVSDTEFSYNKAELGNGGAVCIAVKGSPKDVNATMTSSIFHGNRAGSSGGGLYLGPDTDAHPTPPPSPPAPRVNRQDVSNWLLALSNVTLSYNLANQSGGAIAGRGEDGVAVHVKISDCAVFNNRAGNDSPTPPGGRSPADGGALALFGALGVGGTWAPAPLPDISSDCPHLVDTDQANTPPRPAGSCLLEVQESSFKRCSSAGSGGAVNLVLCTALIGNSTFINNTAALSGGALALQAPNATAVTSAFPISDSWRSLVAWSCVFADNKAATASGGAVWASTGGLVKVCGSNLTQNSAGQDGGAVAAMPPWGDGDSEGYGSSGGAQKAGAVATGSSAGGLLLFGCRVDNNKASGSGGGIFARFVAALAVQHSNMSRNIAGASGGALAVRGGPRAQTTVVVTNVSFTDGIIYANNANSSGGGIYVTGQHTIRLARVQLVKNSAGLYGGAVAAPGGNSGGTSPHLEDCHLANNTASTDTSADFYTFLLGSESVFR